MKKLIQFFFFRFSRLFGRRQINYETVISYGGFIVSVAVLTIALSLLNGYQRTLKEGILNTNGHIYIYNIYVRNLTAENVAQIFSFLAEQPEIESYSAVLMTQAMALQLSEKQASGSNLDPETALKVKVKGVVTRSIDWKQNELPINYYDLITGGTGELKNRQDVVIGDKLAQYMNVDIGDKLRIISPANMRYTMFGIRTGELDVEIVGLYRSGIYDTDAKIIFLNYEAVNSLLGGRNTPENQTLIEIKVKSDYIDRVEYLSHKWTAMLNYEYQIENWIDYNGNLFTMLVLQRWVIFIILSFIILIASFGITSNTIKTVMEKRKEIGILTAIGANKLMIKAYLMGETTLLGILSILTGVIFGLAAAWVLTKQTVIMLQGDVYFIERFSPEIAPISILMIITVSLIIALMASVIALQRISRLNVIETVTGK